MMKCLRFFLAAALLTGALTLSVPALAGPVKQEKCPIMGYKPTDRLFVDYKGKRIYFCCGSCPGRFMKDPDKYVKQLEEEGVYLEDSPAGS